MSVDADRELGGRASRIRPRRRWPWLLVLVACLAGFLGLQVLDSRAPAPEPTPAPPGPLTFASRDLTVEVDGASVTASLTITASRPVTASEAGICVRDADGGDHDFPKDRNVTLSPDGSALTRTAAFIPGTYRYFACARVDGAWTEIGDRGTFSVRAAARATAAAGGEEMPAGDLPGWRRIFAEDFAQDQDAGRWPGIYGDRWISYDGFEDTSGKGDYDQDILSVHDGVLDLDLHTAADGRPKGAAPVPLLDDSGRVTGQTYGRYSVRFKADRLPGYGTGWLLWPSSGDWNDGEIDFPEGSLAGSIRGYNHCPGNPRTNCASVNTHVPFTGWHTATIEWAPDQLRFLLDGKVVETVTDDIPTQPMQWVLQTATSGAVRGEGVPPDPAVRGSVLIDWVVVWAHEGT